MTRSEQHVEQQRRRQVAACSVESSAPPARRQTAHDVPDVIVARDGGRSTRHVSELDTIIAADRQPAGGVMARRRPIVINVAPGQHVAGPIEAQRAQRRDAERRAQARVTDAAVASWQVYESRIGNHRAVADLQAMRQAAAVKIDAGADACDAFRSSSAMRSDDE